MLTNRGRGQWLTKDWVRQMPETLAQRFAGLHVGLKANTYSRSFSRIHLHCLALLGALGDCHNQGWFRNRPAEIKKTPILCLTHLRERLLEVKSYRVATRHSSGTAAVECLLAWMPTFSSRSRVTRTSVDSSLRTIGPPLTSLDPSSKSTSAAKFLWICSQAISSAPDRQSLSAPSQTQSTVPTKSAYEQKMRANTR